MFEQIESYDQDDESTCYTEWELKLPSCQYGGTIQTFTNSHSIYIDVRFICFESSVCTQYEDYVFPEPIYSPMVVKVYREIPLLTDKELMLRRLSDKLYEVKENLYSTYDSMYEFMSSPHATDPLMLTLAVRNYRKNFDV